MNSRYTIYEELKEISSSLPITDKVPYDVPEGYFDNLAAAVLLKIKAQETLSPAGELEALSPLLASIPRKTPFSVPENYFSQTISHLSHITEEEPLPLVLQQIDRKLPYQVPNGYFEQLPAQVLAKVARPKAKVISFNAQKWMRYAAAAVVTGFIALGGLLYFNGKPAIDPAKHPHQWIANKLKNVSSQDMEHFLQTTEPGAISDQQIAKSYSNHKEVHNLLHDVSTSDLSTFVSETSGDGDGASTLN